MKFFKINLQRTLVITLMLLIVIGLTENVFAANVKILGGSLLVDGEPFIIKGVSYSPIPIGVDPQATPPYGDYFTSNHSSIYERDLPLLRDMGGNTIRVSDYNHGADHTDFLNKAYNKGVRPIYVVLSFVFNPSVYSDITSQGAREKIKADFRSMVAQYKNHPAILTWSIGNELNAPNMYGDRLRDLFTLINEMAHEAHEEEGVNFHPVTTSLADIDLVNTISAYDLFAGDLDIWGANVYRGASFNGLFRDFKKASTKPLLVMGFGIDAYDENTGDEYEKFGIPYQATYAESLWKEISANSDVCVGGIIRSYTDEWWLGKTGNTLGGCPDNDPGFHSPCGHPSDSDPDGFANYEWFGIMRVVSPTLEKGGEGGFSLNALEPRKIYFALKSLWTGLQIFPQPGTSGRIPRVLLSLRPLDLTKAPTNEEIMAAGQLGGQLYPTHEIGDKNREKTINLSFGEAIDLWNKHEYKKAIILFKGHVEEYPDSPWASEAVLHMGCDAQYNGRYTEAENHFKWILERHKDQAEEGARRLMNKARTRLATLKVTQNNFKEAKEHFATLIKEGSDWRDRTYGSHWIQRLSRYTANELSMLNCGTQAIAYLLEKEGKVQEARKVVEILPEAEPGHSLKAISDIALQYGYHFSPRRVSPSELKELPLPAIMHIQGKNQGDSGHYWIMEKVNGESLELYDPQSGNRFEQSAQEFSKEWSGIALVFSDRKNLPGIQVAELEMDQLYGGCCGVAAPGSQLGNSCTRYSGTPMSGAPTGPKGSPYWKINMINLNLWMNDVSLWYDSKIGPSVEISLSYNSQSAINQSEPFGNKWILNYGSYLVVDTGGNVTIFMADGKRDVYTKTTNGYNAPYRVFNTLTKIAENRYELKFPNNVIFIYNIPAGTSSQQPFLVEIRDTHNQSLTFGYDANVRLTTITDALNRVTTLTYNEQNLVTLVTDPFNRTASFEYDANRNLTRITDMVGHSTTLTYDAGVYLTSLENQKGRWEFYIEPADGIAVGAQYPPPGAEMWESYRITTTNPLGDKGEYFYYGDTGTYSWYVSPKHYINYIDNITNNYTTAPKTFYYLTKRDNYGEFSKIVDPEGRFVTFGYDSAGNRTSIQDANGKTTTLTYDTQGNVLTITDPLSNSAQFTYDGNNNLTHIVDPKGNNYDLQYTGLDLTKVIDPKTGETNLTYNSYGQLLTLQDAKGNSTSYAYDTSGNPTTVTNPLTGQDSYTYDTIGWVATHTDPKNNTTSVVRDGLGRVTQVTYQDQSTKTFVYDCCKLTSVTDSSGTINFTYDTLKRPATVTDIYGKVISFGYDKNSNLTALTYPDGKIVNYDYDYSGQLTQVKDWLNNVTAYTYDVDGSLSKAIAPDESSVNYQFDNGGRLKSITDSKPDGSLISVYKYALDQSGNRTGISMNQPLTAIPSPPNTTYTHDVDNRLLTAGDISFGYDDNGNLLTKTLGSDVTNYSWDFNDMLSQLTAGTNTYIYRYDGLGNRVAKIVNSVETRYVGGLAETDASGNITAYYVYGFGLISKITPSNESYHYHFDGLGNTIAITDVSGNVVNKYAYDEHGKVLNQEEAIPNPFKYVGQFGVMDEGNGLLYMRARYYDPEVGRFISKDPIGFAGGVNLYGYVANNPVNRVDPGGLIIAQAIGFGVGAAFGAYSAIASGQDTWGVIRSAAVGGLAGALSTIPIPGINPLLSGVIVGGFSGFLGNIGTQYFNPCSKGIDWGSAGLSALAGAGGGLLGSAAGGITSRQGLPVFTKFGQDVISSSVSGIGAGGLDVLLHP